MAHPTATTYHVVGSGFAAIVSPVPVTSSETRASAG